MKKRGWIIVLLLLVILAIAAALMFLNREQPFKEDRTLYDYKDRVVEEIHIVSADHEVLFVKTQGIWKMIKPKPYMIDTTVIRRLDNRLRDFLAARILEEETADLSRYGLDAPCATISFKLDDGTEHKLLIGEVTASKLQYYAKDSAREKIYILGSYDVDNFLIPISKFRDRTILTVDVDAINAIAMSRGDVRDFKLVGDGKAWLLSEPLEIDARSDGVYEILHNISQLIIKDFVSEDIDERDAYGLAQPNHILEMGDAGGQTQTIYFGNVDEEQQIVYIMIDDRGEVFSLSLEAFDPRRFKIGTLLNEAPLSVSIQNIEKVTIIEGDNVIEFCRDTSAEDIVFLYSNKPVNEEYFIALYVNIMALSAEGYDADSTDGLPDLTVILQYIDNGETIMVELIRRDDLSYFLVVNGEVKPFYVLTRKVDLVKWWRNKVLEAMGTDTS